MESNVEGPILFRGPMVRAILEGRKTQTRRVAKCIPSFQHAGKDILDWALSGIYEEDGKWWLDIQTDVDDNSHTEIKCPYGQPGDRLWVRETWCQDVDCNTSKPIEGKALYRADGQEVFKDDGDGAAEVNRDGTFASPWRPSIHMPRWASRITLEVTRVRVERVQEISAKDSEAEGIERMDKRTSEVTVIGRYRQLWDSINAPRGFGWDKNPWVWVIEFRRMT